MTTLDAPELTVKDEYQDCKTYECPRFLALCEIGDDGTKVFSEDELAYTALINCNNLSICLSDGDCPLSPNGFEA